MTPLALYIHWPFCKSKCPYCDFNSHVREAVDFTRWQQALLAELKAVADKTKGRTLTSIFFGGGTPSLMPASITQSLIEAAKGYWHADGDIEITLEANPTSVEINTFSNFCKAGINRVSLGVQSLRQKELTFLGRGHNVSEAKEAIKRASDMFERYSFDLIYARPDQTLEDWENELGEALNLAGNHLSLYQLTIEENTAFHTAYAKKQFALPDDELSAALYLLTEKKCAEQGLLAYEVSNYAKPGAESRHNLTYWQGGDYAGIGPGAHGRLTFDGIRYATQTLKSPERWLEAVSRQGHGMEIHEPTSAQTEAEERMMMGLRLTGGIHYADFETRHGYDLRRYINQSKRDFYAFHGLLETRDDALIPTLEGRLLLSKLTTELLA